MRRRSGFTLVEMLIVLVIIAALVGTITPITLNAVRKANVTAANMDLQAVKSALLQYSIMTGYGTVEKLSANLGSIAVGAPFNNAPVAALVTNNYLSKNDENILIQWEDTDNATIRYKTDVYGTADVPDIRLSFKTW